MTRRFYFFFVNYSEHMTVYPFSDIKEIKFTAVKLKLSDICLSLKA